MKRFLFVFVLVTGVTLLNAQEKSAKDYKIDGAEAYKAKDYKKGLSDFEQAIKLYEAEGKTDTSLYYNAAVCAIKIDNYDKAVSYFDKSIALDYKTCKSKLYKANCLLRLEKDDEMETLCLDGSQTCPRYKSKFNELLFQRYMKAGLEIFNDAAKKQADITPMATTDPDKYTAEMEKVKDEFRKSLPNLEKAHEIDPTDENCKKALKQAYEILGEDAKAAAL